MELYIVRHGQSTNNALGDPTGREFDPPLTEIGLEQAERVSRYMAVGGHIDIDSMVEKPIDDTIITQLYCSPMTRALQTAQFIGQELGLNPAVWVDIHEQGGLFLDQGEPEGKVGFPGRSHHEILEEFPNYILPDEINHKGWWEGAYEDMDSAYERAVRVAEELWKRSLNDERVTLVSHGDFTDMLLKALFKQLAGERLFYSHYNTAISRVNFLSDGTIRLSYLNRVEHLPKGLLTF